MKLKLFVSFALVVGFLVVGVPVFAHHGTGAAYETQKEVTLKGTVTEWIWANPHCGLLFDVTDENGKVEHWGAELGNPHSLSGAGFRREILKPGDRVTVTGHPARSGAPRMDFVRVVLADGQVLPQRSVKGNGEPVDSSE